MTETVTLALDIGGTKMAAALVAPDLSVLEYAVTPTPVDDDPETVFGAAVFVANAVLSGTDAPVSAIGVGCGGPMRWPSGDVSPLNLPAFRDFPLRDRIAAEFGLPTRIHNDAVCLAIGEHLAGAGRRRADGRGSNLMAMVLATGVGAGLILDGRPFDGGTGNAGHIGHLVIDPNGPPCSCGGRGCLEAIARGPALVTWAQDHGWRPTGTADAVALAQAARGGDPGAQAAFRRAGDAVGQAIASAAALLDLDTVSLGGGLVNAADLLLPTVYDAFGRHAGLEFAQRCRIVLASPQAGLVGAAGLWRDGYWNGGRTPRADCSVRSRNRLRPRRNGALIAQDPRPVSVHSGVRAFVIADSHS
ncbi:MAG: ROK family protein [Candidatus Nanopelagicales bacterium]